MEYTGICNLLHFSSFWVEIFALIIYLAIIASCVGVILSENRNPIRSIAWTIALLALPGIGLIFYLFFGRSLKNHTMISRHNKRRLLHNFQINTVQLDTCPISPQLRQLVKLDYALSHSPLTVNNNLEIFTSGQQKFDAFIEDLKNATQNIYLQYYIFQDDKLGKTIADILIAKAREGLDIKVLYDHVGSFSAAGKFFKRMEENNIETHPFFRVTFPQLANRINWRNHRKIAIIDNRTAYIGGMNIADRYLLPPHDTNGWRDTHFRVCGDIVQSLLYSFAVDWFFLRDPDQSLNVTVPSNPIHNDCALQFAATGPIEHWNNIALCFQRAISGATKSIYIQTPYFLPTESLLNALQAAALAKVDVRIMMPEQSDSQLLQYASQSYFTRCLEAGIKLYLYTPGMLHAKSMTIDHDFVTAGSTNFDFRSFENNFESNLLIYNREINSRMRDIFFADLQHCRKIKLTEWRKRPLSQRMLESTFRLFAPIL